MRYTFPLLVIAVCFFACCWPAGSAAEDAVGIPKAGEVLTGPVIVQQPKSLAVTAGDAATFQVVAEGRVPLEYQWLKNGDEIEGRNRPACFFAPVEMADAGEYKCRVTDGYGSSVESLPASLTVSGVPRAQFSYEPQLGQAPLTVTFVDMSLRGSTEILSWRWDFGDKSPYGLGPSVQHTYMLPGLYTVRLTVDNEDYSNTLMVLRAVRVYAGADADSDGDGLSDALEEQNNTDPTNPDSDGDGMDDGWEVTCGFYPLSATDAGADADGDGLTNLDEYGLRSDPLDAASPTRVYYVSTTGNDSNDGSTLQLAWRTIGHAMSSVVADPLAPVTVRLAGGTYKEDVTVRPWVCLAGNPDGESEISGYVTGSANSGLTDLIISDPLSGFWYPLLGINGAMRVSNVLFEGGLGSTAEGIAVYAGGMRGSVIERCEFRSLKDGIVIYESIPLIRRCWFHDLSGRALIVRAVPVPVKQEDGTLSTEEDPNSGYNIIHLPTIAGEPAVVNEREEPLTMENNDWGTNDEEEIGDNVTEGTDYVPYLEKGSAAGAATVNCSVWDAETLDPITNATVTLSPGSFLPLTENTGGVYTFACLSPGAYTFSVTAPGYDAATETRTLAAGDNVMLLFPLGEGGNDGGGGGGCFGGVAERFQGPASGNRGGDSAILLAVVAALIAAALASRLKRA